MENEQQKYGTFSNAAYSLFNPLKSKFENQQNSLKVLNIVVSHRGTNTSSRSNLQSDIAIGFGTQGSTERFQRAVRKDAKIKSSFPDYTIQLTGHSLGGSIGAQSSRENKIKGIFYNIGSGVPTLSSILSQRQKKDDNITHYSTNYDPISIQSKKFNVNQISVKTKKNTNPHALKNFL